MDIFQLLAYPSVIVTGITSLVLLLRPGWRIEAGVMAIQYTGVFFLIGLSWSLNLALSVLVAGWIATLILVFAQLESLPSLQMGESKKVESISVYFFRFLAAIILILVVVSLSTVVKGWVPGVAPQQIMGALVLAGMGLLIIGMSRRPEATIIGLLSFISGFQILYAALESSALLAALLAAIQLSLAIAGAYLQLVPMVEEGDV